MVTQLPIRAETVAVSNPAPFSYEEETVKPLKIRGKYGRYLTFKGRTSIHIAEQVGTTTLDMQEE